MPNSAQPSNVVMLILLSIQMHRDIGNDIYEFVKEAEKDNSVNNAWMMM
jgi:cobalamin biosynthesis protein CobD/CbiB